MSPNFLYVAQFTQLSLCSVLKLLLLLLRKICHKRTRAALQSTQKTPFAVVPTAGGVF